MSLPSLRVAVVGLGTAGPAAALYLHAAGHRVTVFERVSEPQPVGSGLLLQPTGQAVLAELGLLERALDLGCVVHALQGRNHRGRLLMDMSYADAGAGRFGLGMLRGSLFGLLHDALLRAGVELRTGAAVARLPAAEDGRWLETEAGERFGPFDLVLICSGARSSLDHALEAGRRIRPYPWGALWATCDDAGGEFDGILHQRYRRASVMIGVLPCGRLPGDAPGRRRVSLFWSLPLAAYPAWRAAGLEAWKAEVLGDWPALEPLLRQIRDPEQLALASYNDTMMRPCAAGDVLYLGDAAHAMSPQLGQGANLALLDARALARALGGAESVEGALRRYQEARRRHQAYYQFSSRWLTPFYQSHSRVLAAVRDWAMPPMYRLGFMRRAILQTLCGFRSGPFSSEPGLCEPGPALAPLSDGRRSSA